MSNCSPPTLLQLAVQMLIEEEILSISALADLPTQLFPPLFKEAFTRRKSKMLRVIVPAWPFHCLPVGVLTDSRDLETLEAVLGGLEVLLTCEDRPRRWKLQVLELRNVHHDFWSTSAGEDEDVGNCSLQVTRKKQPVEDQCVSEEKQPLKVLSDICLKSRHLDEYQAHLLQWARQRKGSLRVLYKKLQVLSVSLDDILEQLEASELAHVQELEVDTQWTFRKELGFAPNPGQMRNRSFFFRGVPRAIENFEGSFRGMRKDSVFLSSFNFSSFRTLQHLYLNGVHILYNNLHRIFRYLETPLKTVSITNTMLSGSDLDCLSSCQSVHQLEHLNLSHASFSHLCSGSLPVLLERIAATVQTLELEECRLNDLQLHHLLPALSCCSQLTKVNFYGNTFSLSMIRDLLHRTADMSQLAMELYPAPIECYDARGNITSQSFVSICGGLMDSRKLTKHPKSVFFATTICLQCHERCVYNVKVRLCSCLQ